VHLGVIDQLVRPKFSILWEQEIGAHQEDTELVPIILDLASSVREAYQPFAEAAASYQASDTLVTKVLLGTLGCLPACDKYFIDGFKYAGFKYSQLNGKFVERVLWFCQEHLRDLRQEQARIKRVGGLHYPLMKLVDMYFWQTGVGLSGGAT
jgi:hypothetical protein